MNEEVIVPFGCSPQVCVEKTFAGQANEELQESLTYQRYLGIKEEVLLIKERVHKVGLAGILLRHHRGREGRYCVSVCMYVCVRVAHCADVKFVYAQRELGKGANTAQ